MADTINFEIVKTAPEELDGVDALLDCAFGPGREAKTAYRLREGVGSVDALCYVAKDCETGKICGSIQYWPIKLVYDDDSGPDASLMLGPLAIHPAMQGRGIGQALMNHTINLAAELGFRSIILVGDEPYYAKSGFSILGAMGLRMPGPYDPSRLLGRNLVDGALMGKPGKIVKAI